MLKEENMEEHGRSDVRVTRNRTLPGALKELEDRHYLRPIDFIMRIAIIAD